MRFLVLGPLLIRDNGREIFIQSSKQRLLLAVLLCYGNQLVSVDRLIDALWPNDPPKAPVKDVQVLVHRLRRTLGDDGRIASVGSSYRILVQPDEIDTAVFKRFSENGRLAAATGAIERATRQLSSALELWRGAPFGDIGGSSALRAERDRLEECRLAVLEERVEADLLLGRHRELVAELTALVSENPTRERFRGQLMLALYRSGRQAEALEIYRKGRQVLVEELGVEPGTALQQLHATILAADPVLEPGPLASPRLAAVPTPLTTAVPALLPRDVADFTGRDEDVVRLRELLRPIAGHPAVPVVTVYGAPGAGKTALAVHVAHTLLGDFPDGQLFVDLGGASGRPADPYQVLERLLRALGVDSRLLERPDERVDERVDVYRSRLGGRRLLLVLDDAASAAQVRPLLPGIAGPAVLVTSRRRMASLEGAVRVPVWMLPTDDGVRMLGRVCGPDRVAEDEAAAGEIVRACGHLPLAIRIAGSRLATRPHWPLHRLAARLSTGPGRLDELAIDGLDLRTVVAHSLEALDQDMAVAFGQLMSHCHAELTAGSVASRLGCDETRSEEILDTLVDSHLLEVIKGERQGVAAYRWSNLVHLCTAVDPLDRAAETGESLTFVSDSARLGEAP
ncbi:MAG: BTAD domain-containing putative transcriptional regulator [Micromonosporaceae bacterium]